MATNKINLLKNNDGLSENKTFVCTICKLNMLIKYKHNCLICKCIMCNNCCCDKECVQCEECELCKNCVIKCAGCRATTVCKSYDCADYINTCTKCNKNYCGECSPTCGCI